MNNSEPKVEIKKLIPTTKGPIQITNSSDLLVLAHENLHPQISKIASKPINAQTLYYHRNNLLSLQNSSITPSLIDHQIHDRLSQEQVKQTLIVDSSSTLNNQKTAEVFKKYHVVRGYNYQLPSAVTTPNIQALSKESEVLISKEHIKKQLNYVFGASGEQQKGLIGQIDLTYHYKLSQSSKFYYQAFSNAMSCYQEYSSETGCPIYINLLQHGFNAFNTQHAAENIIPFAKLVEFLFSLLGNQQIYKNIVLINPQFQINRNISQSQIVYENANKENIQKLYQLGFNLCFDICRYQNQNCLVWVAHFVQKRAHQSIISAGLKFKTDFISFSGEGYLMNDSIKSMNFILANNSNQLYKLVMKQNTLKLLSWFEKKIFIVQIKKWKCVKCGKESPQTEESFRKFGKDFCSIDCLRSFKF